MRRAVSFVSVLAVAAAAMSTVAAAEGRDAPGLDNVGTSGGGQAALAGGARTTTRPSGRHG